MVVAISLYYLIGFLKLVSAPLDIVDRQKFPTSFLVDFPSNHYWLATLWQGSLAIVPSHFRVYGRFVHESHVFLAKWSNETSSEVAFIADNLV
jgi:hypothetical protein